MVKYDKSTADRGARWVRNKGTSKGVAVGGTGAVVTLLIALFLGGDIASIFEASQQAQTNTEATVSEDDIPCDDGQTEELLCFLMEDLNTTWDKKFKENNLNYEPTYLNIYSGGVTTQGCGYAPSAVGPFYCPAPSDETVYIDLGFYDDLKTEFEAPGDFAQAYVVAHEVGHHVSNLTGDAAEINRLQQAYPQGKNTYQIFLELQADCYAGVWANSASERRTSTGEPIIEPDDINEGLKAAAAVGDDRIQEKATGQVEPHNWTHGSSEQRQQAFKSGLKTGVMKSCSLDSMQDIASSGYSGDSRH